MTTVVFLGPTLPVAHARDILPTRYLPPARLGSIYELIGSEVTTIALVDGVFHNVPSVWQREVDAALQAGITVAGASSMGALRAAELHRFGMIGHGVVFGWYRDGAIDGDDEVALLHGDADAGYRPLSEPLVNIRATIAHAVAAGIVPAEHEAAIVALAKRPHYPQRSFARLVEDLRRSPLAAYAEPLARFPRTDIKREDAVSLLTALRDGTLARPAPVPFEVRARHGRARLDDLWRAHGHGYRRFEHAGRAWTHAELETADEIPDLGGTGTIVMTPERRHRLANDRAVRALALAYAEHHGLVTPPRYLTLVTARLRAAVDVTAWMRACRITGPELAARLAGEAALAWFADEPPVDVAWTDPLADPGDLGLYLRVFADHRERLTARRVALAALLEERDDSPPDYMALVESAG